MPLIYAKQINTKQERVPSRSYNIMISDNCQIKNSREKGEGLYARKDFKRGDIVYVCEVEMSDCPNSVHASQIAMEKWITFSKMGRSMNHSCDPNCGVGFNGKNWVYKAFKDIKAGEELTYDYAMANYKVENFPKCLCESSKCRGQIKGYRTLPLERKKEYLGFFAPYLQEMTQEQIQQQ